MARVIDTGSIDNMEDEVDLPAGKRVFWTSMQRIKMPNGQYAVQIISYEITERKRMEQALRESKFELERIVAERTAELQSVNVQLRALTQDIVATQEEERRRISRELHDEAGQALTALKLLLQMTQDGLPRDSSELSQQLDEAVALTDNTIEQIRLLAQYLRPPALESAGLDVTLEGLCREFARRTQIHIEYIGTELPDLPGAADICLYRFLQEAMTNAVRHGRASQLSVHLHVDVEGVSLEVQDNGLGFDAQGVLASQIRPAGIGLVGMQERLKMLGGRLEIESQPRRGTSLIAHIPLEDA
jgi:signal transduction histidine kinase